MNVSEPAERQGIRKGELTGCQIRPPGERQRAGSAARDPEGGTHRLSDQAARRTSASRQGGERSRRENSPAARTCRQDNFSEADARQGIRKGGLTGCQTMPQDNVSEPAARRGMRKGGAHVLSDQAARRTSASWQREGSGRGNSQAVRSNHQANVSESAVRREESGRGTHRLSDQAAR